jgi:hypothetical protein
MINGSDDADFSGKASNLEKTCRLLSRSTNGVKRVSTGEQQVLNGFSVKNMTLRQKVGLAKDMGRGGLTCPVLGVEIPRRPPVILTDFVDDGKVSARGSLPTTQRQTLCPHHCSDSPTVEI